MHLTLDPIQTYQVSSTALRNLYLQTLTLCVCVLQLTLCVCVCVFDNLLETAFPLHDSTRQRTLLLSYWHRAQVRIECGLRSNEWLTDFDQPSKAINCSWKMNTYSIGLVFFYEQILHLVSRSATLSDIHFHFPCHKPFPIPFSSSQYYYVVLGGKCICFNFVYIYFFYLPSPFSFPYSSPPPHHLLSTSSLLFRSWDFLSENSSRRKWFLFFTYFEILCWVHKEEPCVCISVFWMKVRSDFFYYY